MPSIPVRAVLSAAVLTLAALLPLELPADPLEEPSDRIRRVKALQRDLLTRKAWNRIREAREALLNPGAPAPLGRRRAKRNEAVLEAERAREDFARAGVALGEPPLATNVQVNSLVGDDAFASQNEPSIAAWGTYVLAAWNDWPGGSFQGSQQGYAFSLDGGQTFVDGGEIPRPPNYFWFSDPVVTVNEKTGDFFYCALLENSDETMNGIAVVRADFAGGVFSWSSPFFVRVEPYADHYLDKPWIVADSSSGYLYITYTDFTYTDFTVNSVDIVLQRSRDRGLNWGSPLTLNSPQAAGKVQGSRPAVGADGEVYAVWKEISLDGPGFDFMRIRRSSNRGASFGPEQTAATFFDNFGTGAPGFNRQRSVAFPAIAVDRTSGPNRGRVHVSWNESLNWFDDVPAVGPIRAEVENNDFFARATPFTVGEALVGSIGNGTDRFDTFKFSAVQGMHYIFWSDNVPVSLYKMRVFCSDTITKLTFGGHPEPPLDAQGNQGIMVWTAPTTGTYYLDVAFVSGYGSTGGPYRVRTGFAETGPLDRGRDQRDAFVASSSDGIIWNAPVLLNDDPPYFENWLPEVAVSGFGAVYAAWFDWRDSPAAACGGVSHIYMSRSEDGGNAWTSLGRLTEQGTNWTYVRSNLIPNQGDYLGLYANDQAVYVAWTDGRGGTPDIFAATVPSVPESLQVLASKRVTTTSVTITWRFRVPRVVTATVYREVGGTRVALGTSRQSDAEGKLVHQDDNVQRGLIYTYSLGIQTDGPEFTSGLIRVVVPAGALLAQPNPFAGSTELRYDVPSPGGDVKLVIYDMQGRLVRTLVNQPQLGGTYPKRWDRTDDQGKTVNAGVYFARLRHPAGSETRRLILIP